VPTDLAGVSRQLAVMRRLQTFAPDQFGQALRQEAEIEATECKNRTPVDTGTLRASIHVVGPERSSAYGRIIRCWIVAGGAAERYALIVHEDLEAFHKYGQARYISSVIEESAPYLLARVLARINLNQAVA
jgi:Bacteriophage HK97-gp10, putative tail-component